MDELLSPRHLDQLTDIARVILNANSSNQATVTPNSSASVKVLSWKVINHLESVLLLSKGTPSVHDFSGESMILDVGSIYTLVRAMFEAHLTIHHLFVDAISTELRQLRIDAWKLDAFLQRTKVPHVPEESAKYESERLRINELRDSIRINPHLVAMAEPTRMKLKKKYLSGNWRGTLGWKDLAECAGYIFDKSDTSRVGEHYSLFSAYAHSGYLAIMQLADMDLDARSDFVTSALEFAQIIVSHLINDLRLLFENAESIVDQHRYIRKVLLDLRMA